ncbi:AAWKG family protein [Streptomyces scabiei]|uniref:AAWKG family protein n=1 Tax=Streptomyces scabiei TaxID=1930 RepID=UPI0029B1562F|nr:AAWKG family protein [Streptomyces scabiei]MDX3117802.1 AAWKG family protein [Streptomyces scabiei]
MADSTPEDDYWARAVSLFTGYTMPSRSQLFEKLKSDKGVPLFRHGIENLGTRAVHLDDIGRNARSGEDYDVVFYTSSGGDGAHGGVKLKRVRIVLIGVLADKNGRALFFDETKDPLGGKWAADNTFTGIGGDQWDASAMAQYIFGGRNALGALTDEDRKYSTKDFSFAGQFVPDSSAVDLLSFTRTAQAFDRTKEFFVRRAETLEQWQKALGSEQSSWHGKAAGVFRGLIEQLHKNYAGYADQLGGKGYVGPHLTVDGYAPTSEPGHAVTVAQRNLLAQAKVLHYAWQDWADSGRHDPHRVVVGLLDELVRWLFSHNLTQVVKRSGGTTYAGAPRTPTIQTTADFLQVHPVYGDLSKDAAWVKLGELAVTRWREWQDHYVEKQTREALARLSNQWLDVAKQVAVPLRTRDATSLTEAYQKEETRLAKEEERAAKEEARRAKEEAKKDGDDLGKVLENLGRQVNAGMKDFAEGVGHELGGFGGRLNEGMNGFAKDVNNSLGDVADGFGEGVRNLDKSLNQLGDGIGDSLDGAFGGQGNATGGSAPPVTSPLNDLPFGPGSDPSDSNGAGTLTNPDGSTTTRSADGTLTTAYPDGTVTVLNPSTGVMTTTSPDGKSTTTPVGRGRPVTGPDGSTTVLNPDGSLTTKYPDGSVQTIQPDGTVTTTDPDGTVHSSQLDPSPGTVTTPSGAVTKLNPDGTLTTSYPDGTKETVDPSRGTMTTTSPDGTTHTDPLGSGKQFTNPDGSTTALNPDGSLTTKYPDGSVQTVEPDGTVITTDPDGKVTTTDLDGSSAGAGSQGGGGTSGGAGAGGGGASGLNDGLPEPGPSGPDRPDQPGDDADDYDFDSPVPGLGPGGPTVTPLNPDLAGLGGGADSAGTGGSGSDSYEEYDSTPYDGGALGAPTGDSTDSASNSSSAAQDASGGMPLNPMAFGGMGGMGAMGGMGGAGGGGAGGSNGERVRSVLTDGDGAALRRRRGGRGAAAADEDEDVIVTRGGRPVTTSTPYAPLGVAGGQGGRSTESGDRVRSNWGTEEDDDVWGTDEGGAPAVIGR